jgi:16S rRNA (adenine1518-N6/adenine1519-N6)-dimethyltransferase
MNIHQPRKRFGQHFLRDSNIIQKIINAINPSPEQHLVEIGPGQGALTFPLLEYNCRLDLIELDRDLITRLEPKTTIFPQVQIHHADALTFDLKSLITQQQPLRLVGNLPYNISTPLLFHFIEAIEVIQDMTFMLQKEVVDRMIARPATAHYGRLSVMLQYHYQMTHLFDVAPTAFSPPPQVNSSVIQLLPHPTPPVEIFDQQRFAQIVSQAFSQRRKTLRNTLKNKLTDRDLETIGINPQRRAETLTLQEFAQLTNYTVG